MTPCKILYFDSFFFKFIFILKSETFNKKKKGKEKKKINKICKIEILLKRNGKVNIVVVYIHTYIRYLISFNWINMMGAASI